MKRGEYEFFSDRCLCCGGCNAGCPREYDVNVANDDDLLDDALFFAGDSTIASFIPGWNDLGGVTRIWGFDPSIQFIPNYAATDNPFSVEYQQWLKDNNAVDVNP